MTMNDITAVNAYAISRETVQTPGLQDKLQPKERSFGELLMGALEGVNEMQIEADRSIEDLTTGASKDIHQTMIAMEKADVSLKLMVQVRDKVVDAYKQLMQMQI